MLLLFFHIVQIAMLWWKSPVFTFFTRIIT